MRDGPPSRGSRSRPAAPRTPLQLRPVHCGTDTAASHAPSVLPLMSAPPPPACYLRQMLFLMSLSQALIWTASRVSITYCADPSS